MYREYKTLEAFAAHVAREAGLSAAICCDRLGAHSPTTQRLAALEELAAQIVADAKASAGQKELETVDLRTLPPPGEDDGLEARE